MEIIRFADLKPEPWRNGGGVTRQIAGHSGAGSGHDGGWDWRVSIAEVGKAGEFSPFPGMERVLTVVEGELLLLTVDGAEHPLEKYRAFRFPGGAETTCALPTGDVRNLNVITRAGKYKGFTSIIEMTIHAVQTVPHIVFGIHLSLGKNVMAQFNDITKIPRGNGVYRRRRKTSFLRWHDRRLCGSCLLWRKRGLRRGFLAFKPRRYGNNRSGGNNQKCGEYDPSGMKSPAGTPGGFFLRHYCKRSK